MLKAIIGLAGVTVIAGSQGSALASSVPLYTVAQAKTKTTLTQKQIKLLEDFSKQQKDIKNIQKNSKTFQQMPAMKFKRIAQPPKSSKIRYINTNAINYINRPYYYLSPQVVEALLKAQRNREIEKDIDGMTCTYTQRTADASNLQQNAVSLSAQNKWGGALVRALNRNGGRATSGNFSQYPIPAGMDREPYWVGTNQAALPPEEVDPPARVGYDRALGRIVRGHRVRDVGNSVSFYMAKSSRAESVLAKAGINGSGTNWSANFEGQTERSRNKNTIMMLFIQKPFTTAVDYGPSSPVVGLLGNGASRRLPRGWQQDAAYISSITYGKILILKMESTDTLEKMEAAVRAAYTGLTSRGSARMSTSTRETLSNAKYSVWAQGGDSRSVLNTIQSWAQGNPRASLNNYFSTDNESLNLYPAISYDLRYLSNGRAVSNSTVIVEDQESCRQNSTAMHLSLIYKHIRTEDSTGADEMRFRTFTINGRDHTNQQSNEIWNVRGRDMNDGDSVTLYQDTCVEVPNQGANQFLDVSTTFYDKDPAGWGDSDDRVWGNYRDSINLSALARQLRSNNRPFNETIREGGRDGARGRLTVRISPNARCTD